MQKAKKVKGEKRNQRSVNIFAAFIFSPHLLDDILHLSFQLNLIRLQQNKTDKPSLLGVQV